ncbi:helix-turn-helix domain-containing protein [Agromyces protaetiae]|uniref:helix-turn-helix domain-containing protein n=1 Tax=Agromyces protaetiae TaxID=2509455 RepID=UPI001AA0844B|nr:helix-turn-helix domain-containing protein [Agromyces protaetiae]
MWAVASFEEGLADTAVSTLLGVPRGPVRHLYQRWRIRGRGALVSRTGRPSYSFEFKLALVKRFLAGEEAVALAEEAGLSSPVLLKTWARKYRNEGEEALRPKPKGRPPGSTSSKLVEESELERLRRENEYLRAQNAYLGKLRALMDQKRRTR